MTPCNTTNFEGAECPWYDEDTSGRAKRPDERLRCACAIPRAPRGDLQPVLADASSAAFDAVKAFLVEKRSPRSLGSPDASVARPGGSGSGSRPTPAWSPTCGGLYLARIVVDDARFWKVGRRRLALERVLARAASDEHAERATDAERARPL